MRQQDARVPAEVEEYLVGLNAAAGQLGGRIGTGGAGARGGARGGAAGARMLKTAVEERAGRCSGGAGEVLDRIAAALPRAREMGRQDDLVRIDVPIGRTGLQHIVVDMVFGLGGVADIPVRLRAYGKEGLLSRKPTRSVADQVWTAACRHETTSAGPAVTEAGHSSADGTALTAGDAASTGLGGITASFVGALAAVLAEIPAPWDTVWLFVEGDSPAGLTSWAYRRTPGSRSRIHAVGTFDPEPFCRHWEAMRQLESPLPWTSLTVTIRQSHDGDATFHSDYGYGPVPLDEQTARAQRWISAYLPPGISVEDRLLPLRRGQPRSLGASAVRVCGGGRVPRGPCRRGRLRGVRCGSDDKAAYTGMLKAFLDRYGSNGPAATGPEQAAEAICEHLWVLDHASVVARQLNQCRSEVLGESLGALVGVEAPSFFAAGDHNPPGQAS